MVLNDGKRSASGKAVTNSTRSKIGSDQLRELIHTQPSFAELLILKLISRIRALTHTTRGFALSGVKVRVVALLEEHAVVDGDTNRVPRVLMQQEIANRIGASREMVNHVLRDLIKGLYIQNNANQRMTTPKDLPKPLTFAHILCNNTEEPSPPELPSISLL